MSFHPHLRAKTDENSNTSTALMGQRHGSLSPASMDSNHTADGAGGIGGIGGIGGGGGGLADERGAAGGGGGMAKSESVA